MHLLSNSISMKTLVRSIEIGFLSPVPAIQHLPGSLRSLIIKTAAFTGSTVISPIAQLRSDWPPACELWKERVRSSPDCGDWKSPGSWPQGSTHPKPSESNKWPSLVSYCSYYLLTIFNCQMHTQSCLTLCGPMDWSPPGSSVHGISQGRILEWVAISSSRGSS